MTDATGWCWGRNLDGELGDGTRINRTTPVQVATFIDLTHAMSDAVGRVCTIGTEINGEDGSIAIDRGALCWGNILLDLPNQQSYGPSPTFITPGLGGPLLQIAGGEFGLGALRANDHSVYCGLNFIAEEDTPFTSGVVPGFPPPPAPQAPAFGAWHESAMAAMLCALALVVGRRARSSGACA